MGLRLCVRDRRAIGPAPPTKKHQIPDRPDPLFDQISVPMHADKGIALVPWPDSCEHRVGGHDNVRVLHRRRNVVPHSGCAIGDLGRIANGADDQCLRASASAAMQVPIVPDESNTGTFTVALATLMCYPTRPRPLSEFPPFCAAPQPWTAGSRIFRLFCAAPQPWTAGSRNFPALSR